MTIPMFSGSGNKTRLLRKLVDVWICKELMMAHIYFQLTDTISNSELIHTSGSLRSSLVVYPDPGNIGIAVGILSL